MKKSTKLMVAVLFAATIFSVKNANAQTTMASNPWRFGIGAEAGIATGSISNTFGGVLGGTARLQYNASKSLGITLTSGYYNFFTGGNYNATTNFGNSTYATNAHDLGMIPVKLGIKAYFGQGMYFSAEGGAGFETKYNEATKLILSPGLGWSNNTWDVGARYESFSGQSNNYGLVALRIAYGFGL